MQPAGPVFVRKANFPLNQNRNNNRRRGRGNNRGGQGGGNQGNRIDSRARGNAPQLLEKYRKLAHDASLNGDRVQTEYYLQFADHYFRVIADSRTQREEQRPRQERETSQDYEYAEEEELAEGGRQNGYQQQPRRERDEEGPAEGEPAVEGERAEDAGEEANPFVREARGRKAPRPRVRSPKVNGAAAQGGEGAAATDNSAPESTGAADEPAGFDPGLLPPSISREAEEPAEARPRGRRRRTRPADEGDNETLEAVG